MDDEVRRCMDDDIRRCAEESRRKLASMTPEECYAVVDMLREMKPRFATARQREIVESFIREFEQRAIDNARHSPSS